MSRRAATWLLILGLGACSKAGEESSEAKRSPIPPPPPEVEVAAGLEIPVERGGQAIDSITADELARTAPDFADEDRRAWRLQRLLGDVAAPGVLIEAVGRDGVGISMRVPAADDGPQPVLFFTRRGDLVAAVVHPDDPFPDYHGQGGRLRRPGDPLPRLTAPVVKLVVHADGKPPTATATGIAALTVEIDGAAARPLSTEQIASLSSSEIANGEGASRRIWPLRELVHELGGAGARLTAVIGEREESIDAARWRDATVTPVLQQTGRGNLKLVWFDADGGEQEGSVRSVRRLVIAR